MSKCVNCGSEILTGDIHWEMGLCNNCYNELYKDHKTHISLDKMWLELAQSFRDENEELQDRITDLQHRLEVAEIALNKMSEYAIENRYLYNLVNDFYTENERYDIDPFCINTCVLVVDYFKEQAEKELKGEKNE